MFKVTKRYAASLYRKAAALIQKHGFRQHRLGNPATGMCAIGALCEAISPGCSDSDTVERPALAWKLPLGTQDDVSYELISFNNAPETTQADVVKRLRTEAYALEHGGKVRGQK